MDYLFNSSGSHIANWNNKQLHSTSGQNIGHYLENQKIFIDLSGEYLGEIVAQNRLMRKTNSPYQSINFGAYGNCGNIGNYGNPGNYGSVGHIGGYEDVPKILLE